jgi:hypothetical protein
MITSAHTAPLTTAELHRTFTAMRNYGGDFVLCIASAWFAADPINRARLEAAFPDLLLKYGPASPFYAPTPAHA